MTALVTALGVGFGAFAFFNVYPGRPQIGIIDIPYTTIDDDSAFVIGEMLDYALRTDNIKAVVIKLVTPGGDVATSEQLYLKTISLKERKPVVVATGRIAASGGMLFALAANYIYTESGAFVGSIGVILNLSRPRPLSELTIMSGPAKASGGTQREFTRMMEQMKNSFIRRVVFHRGDKLRMSAAELAEARLYVGSEAVELGLVDAIGADTHAIEKAASLAGISNYGLVDINEKVLQKFVQKQRRIFGAPQGDESQPQWPDIGRLRRLAMPSQGTAGPSDLPIGSPADVDPPRMYYFYVPPTQ